MGAQERRRRGGGGRKSVKTNELLPEGYVFTPVSLLGGLYLCLFVCKQDYK